MRDRTQARVEEPGADKVHLALVEAGIEIGLKMMKEMVATYGGASPEMASHDAKAEEAKAGETEQAQFWRRHPPPGSESAANE